MAWRDTDEEDFQPDLTANRNQVVPPGLRAILDQNYNLQNDLQTRELLRVSIVAKGQTIEQFVAAVKSFFGFQPVRQVDSRELLMDDDISVSDTSYLSYLLQWAQLNWEAFRQFLIANFDHSEGEVQAHIDDLVYRNCTDVVDMGRSARAFMDTHPAAQAFKSYFAREPRVFDMHGNPFLMVVPRYNVHAMQRAMGGVSARRRRAMMKGFKNMRRSYTAHACLQHLYTLFRVSAEMILEGNEDLFWGTPLGLAFDEMIQEMEQDDGDGDGDEGDDDMDMDDGDDL